MCCKMCVTVALCLSFLFAFSEGFFMPATLRKQPDCVRRAPQTAFNSQQWIPGQNINGNNPTFTAPGTHASSKDYNPVNSPQGTYGNPNGPYQQQPQPQQTQAAYPSQIYAVQATAPKYEPTPFQSVNQPQYSYEGIYPATVNSYAQSVQLVPCLCPVNKEVVEQQNQQLQQQNSLSASPTSAPFSTDTNNNNGVAPLPQTSPKKA